MKRIITVLTLIIVSLIFSLCGKDFLEYTPKGTISGEQLNTPERLDGMVTAAYAYLGADMWNLAHSHMWVYGGVRAEDEFKGGGSVTDQFQYHQFEVFSLITVDQSRINQLWEAIYNGVARANEALRRMEEVSDTEYPEKAERMAEARFIRGHFHFVAKRIWKYIPYIDHTIPEAEIKLVDNRQ